MTQEYSQDVKAAVMAALMEGQSIAEVAREYSIPEGTIKSWRFRQKNEPVAVVATDKRQAIGDLLLGYLEANLTALQAQVKVFSDPDWLKKQDASEAAVLHGVMTDKAVRLLEAMNRAGSTD